MKKIFGLLFLTLFWGIFTSSAQAQFAETTTKNTHIRASLGYESEYVFRGSKLAQNVATSSIELSHSFCNFTPYIGYFSISPFGGQTSAQQVNPYAGISWDITDMFTVDAGFTYYWFTKANAGSSFLSRNTNRQREVYLGITADVLLSPAFYLYYNFDLQQWALEPSIAHSIDLDCFGLNGFSLDISALLGWLYASPFNGNQRAPGVPKHKNTYWYTAGSLDLTYHFNDHLSISAGPRVAYNSDGKIGGFAAGGPYTANALGGHHHMFWGGASVNVDF